MDDARDLATGLLGLVPGIERTGVVVEEVSPRRVRATMPIVGNGNHVDVMYAGSLFTLAELSGGLVAMGAFGTEGYYPVVRDVAIAFLRPARTDVVLDLAVDDVWVEDVRRRAEADGKADFDLDVELRDADGVVVATSANRYQLRRLDLAMPPAGG